MVKSENLIPGEQLMTRLGIRRIDIAELSYIIIKFGLTVLEERPRKSWFSRFRKPEYQGIDSEELLEIIHHDPEKLASKLFLLSEIERLPPSRVKLRDNIPSSSLAEVPSSKSENPESELELGSEVADISGQMLDVVSERLLKEVIEDHEEAIKKSLNVFSRLGRVWFIKFKNEEWGLYPDHEKYKYVANLLSLSSETTEDGKAEYAIHIVGLVARVKGNELPPDDDTKSEDGDLNESDLSEEITSGELRRIAEIGNELLDKLREAKRAEDQAGIRKIQGIIAKYRSHLLKEHGIKTGVSDDEKRITFKSLHRSSKEIEKVRQLVKNQISNAIKDLSKRTPLFATHLQHSLRTRTHKAVYSPEHPIPWTVST